VEIFCKQSSGFQTLQGRNTQKILFKRKYWGHFFRAPKMRSKSFPLLCCREFLADICMDFIIQLDTVLEGW